MEKEPVTKFDLEAAFKALDELDIPVAEKGIAANRVNLTETFANARNNKLKTELLVEDYYDLNSEEDLEQAKTDREDEIAKAKLARIEKIVDLDAESPEDLQPSYVGKVIIQCPQCMTLFYKDPADIEPSEDDDSVVNINEVCQHCGNASGYNVIGKVDAVSEEEAGNFDEAEAETETPVEEDELSLDFEEPTEEVDAEGTGEAETTLEEPEEETEEDALNLDFTDTEEEEEEKEEKKEESLNLSKVQKDAEEGSELATDNHSENLTLNEEATDESLNNSEAQKDAEEHSELATENHSDNLTLNEEGNAAWKALSTKPRDLLSKIKDDPNYKATDKYVFYGTDEKGNVLETVEYEHTSDKISELKAERNKVFDKNDKIETVYVSRFYHNIEKDEDEEVEIDSYMISRNKVDESLETEADTLTEASVKELDDKLKAHNEYIEYLKKMIEQEEAALKTATNEEVKAAIQRRLDAFNDDLNAALPEAVKDDLAAEELPTPEEAASGSEETAGEETETTEETTESVNKSENTAEIAKDELPDAKTLHEDVITVKVDTADGDNPIVTVEQEPSTPVEEPVAEPVCVGTECEAPVAEPCVGPECEVVPPVVADIPAVEEPVVVDDVEARMAADANSAVDELAAEFGIDDTIVEPGEAKEQTEAEETEDKDDDDDDDNGNDGSGEAPVDEGILSAAGSVVNGVVDGVKNLLASDEAEKKDLEECSKITEESAEDTLMHELETPVSEEEVRDMMSDLRNEDINITNNDSPARVDNRTIDNTAEAPTAEEKPVEEGILGAVGDVVGGIVGGVENLLASDEAEKKSMDECAKTEEGLGLFGIGDVNVNLDASGQNNAVGVGGGEGKTEELETEGIIPDGLPTPPVKVPGLSEETEEKKINEELNEEAELDELFGFSAEEKFDKKATSYYDGGFRIVVWTKNDEGRTRVDGGADNIDKTASGGMKELKKAKEYAKTKSAAEKTCVDIYGIKGGNVDTEFLYAYENGAIDKHAEKFNEITITIVDSTGAVVDGKEAIHIKRKDIQDAVATQDQAKKAEKASKGLVADDSAEADTSVLGALAAAKKYTGKWIVLLYYQKDDSSWEKLKTGDKQYDNLGVAANEIKKAINSPVVVLKGKIFAKDGGKTYQLVEIEKGAEPKKLAKAGPTFGYDDFIGSFKESLETSADLTLFEEIDEESFTKHISESLQKIYENVDGFTLTGCNLEDSKLVIEGTINFKSANTKATKYVFNSALTEDNKVILTGLNESFAKEEAFTLTCTNDNNKLIAEKLAYKYTVDNILVEGYTGE